MANWYWFDGHPGSQNNGLWRDDNWNSQADASGVWGQPGAGDHVYMTDNYSSGDCLLTGAAVSIGELQMSELVGWSGTLTIASPLTLTLDSELNGTLAISSYLQCNAVIEIFGAVTGAGEFRFADDIDFKASNWSGFTGTIIFNGAGQSKDMWCRSVALPVLKMDAAGATLTARQAPNCQSLVVPAGIYDGASLNHTIADHTISPGAAGGTIRNVVIPYTQRTADAQGITDGGGNKNVRFGPAMNPIWMFEAA